MKILKYRIKHKTTLAATIKIDRNASYTQEQLAIIIKQVKSCYPEGTQIETIYAPDGFTIKLYVCSDVIYKL